MRAGNGAGGLERVGRAGAEEPERARDPPQEAIVPGERVRVVIGQEPRAPDRARSAWMVLARRTAGMPRAVEHHERLGDELDVDEAAAAELDVQAARRLLAELALHAVAQLAHLLQVRRRRVGTVEQVADRAPHRAAQSRVAADEPGARQRLALPGVRPLPVVAPERVEARRRSRCPCEPGRRRRSTGKAMPAAVMSPRSRAERLDGAIVEDVGVDRLAAVGPSGPPRSRDAVAEDDEEVEVGARRQLAPAELADPHDRRGDRCGRAASRGTP